MKCRYCDRTAATLNSNRQHEIRCKANPAGIEVKPSYGMLGKKGANQYTYGAVFANETKAKIAQTKERNGTFKHSEESKQKLSETMKRVVKEKPESYTSANRGRTKQILYDGVKFQGNWELIFYKWCEDNGVKCVRNTTGFPYTWHGERTYFPDFYLPEFNTYVEVKGFKTERDEAKWKYFPNNLLKVFKEDIIKIQQNKFALDATVA